MHGRVGRIDELSQDDGTRGVLTEFFRLGDGAFHSFGARGEHDLCAESLEQVATLDAHRVGHRQDCVVALGTGNPGESDAGVAAGGLDDGGAGLEVAGALGVLDHGEGDAVLDAAAGVEQFEFEGDARLLAFQAGDLQERCVPDEVSQCFVNHDTINIRIIHKKRTCQSR